MTTPPTDPSEPCMTRDDLWDALGIDPDRVSRQEFNQYLDQYDKAQNFDENQGAVDWARTKIMHHVERAARFSQEATTKNYPRRAKEWGKIARYMRQTLIGGQGCVIAAFDERLPAYRKMTRGK